MKYGNCTETICLEAHFPAMLKALEMHPTIKSPYFRGLYGGRGRD